jgi:2,3-diaminopropionate biosynthesis protein SbnB
MPQSRPFHVIGGATIRAMLGARHREVVALVRETYRLHHAGRTINPDSYFLRFPDKPTARIIALPARLQTDTDIAGIKWISSFPDNRARGLERASAAVLLNDMRTGFPYACLEGSHISAARTAASAALGAELLHGGRQAREIAVIGAGPIAAAVVDCLIGNEWTFARLRVHDLVGERAAAFARSVGERGHEAAAVGSAGEAIAGADLVLFATTAAAPYIDDPALFGPLQTVLHVSLRDLGVRVILSAQNVVDDVEHCLKAQTSPHLAEQQTGSRAFVAGTIGDLISGRVTPDRGSVRIFSPFGLGVLDLALARFVYDEAVAAGSAVRIDGFFA